MVSWFIESCFFSSFNCCKLDLIIIIIIILLLLLLLLFYYFIIIIIIIIIFIFYYYTVSKVSFAILRSALLCLKGARTPKRTIRSNVQEADFELDRCLAKI